LRGKTAATVEAAVNIREVIEKLQEMATRLPDGLDSEVVSPSATRKTQG
jgi:hypothetical protein